MPKQTAALSYEQYNKQSKKLLEVFSSKNSATPLAKKDIQDLLNLDKAFQEVTFSKNVTSPGGGFGTPQQKSEVPPRKEALIFLLTMTQKALLAFPKNKSLADNIKKYLTENNTLEDFISPAVKKILKNKETASAETDEEKADSPTASAAKKDLTNAFDAAEETPTVDADAATKRVVSDVISDLLDRVETEANQSIPPLPSPEPTKKFTKIHTGRKDQETVLAAQRAEIAERDSLRALPAQSTQNPETLDMAAAEAETKAFLTAQKEADAAPVDINNAPIASEEQQATLIDSAVAEDKDRVNPAALAQSKQRAEAIMEREGADATAKAKLVEEAKTALTTEATEANDSGKAITNPYQGAQTGRNALIALSVTAVAAGAAAPLAFYFTQTAFNALSGSAGILAVLGGLILAAAVAGIVYKATDDTLSRRKTNFFDKAEKLNAEAAAVTASNLPKGN